MDESPTPFDGISKRVQHIQMIYQGYLDKTTPFMLYRWVSFGVLFSLFMLRIILAQGWYIVCYILAIYLLSLFLAFLQPKFNPVLEQETKDAEIEEGLPTNEDDEFRPFIRRLPEFKFWYRGIRAITISLVCAFIPACDIPVFWPILLIYFIILLTATLRKQIEHMIKYKYLPFDIGKTKYGKKQSK